MSIKIELDNIKVSDNGRLLNNTSIRKVGDFSLNVKNLDLNGQAIVFENLEIDSMLDELDEKVQKMDKNSDEYYKIEEILKVERSNKKKIYKCIVKHLSEFSQGVLASVVANFLTNI